MAGGGAVAAGVEHAREQLVRGLPGLELEQVLLVVLAEEHQL